MMFDRELAPLGITRSQWWVLAFISRKDGLPQTQLANELDVGKVALGALIDRLETSGFVIRQADPVDRRVKRVYLTKQARGFLERLRKEANGIDTLASPYKAIVSVLMLKEGWDVRNVTTIVGLRAYVAQSNILPEQTLGRGLRRMYFGNDVVREMLVAVVLEDDHRSDALVAGEQHAKARDDQIEIAVPVEVEAQVSVSETRRPARPLERIG